MSSKVVRKSDRTPELYRFTLLSRKIFELLESGKIAKEVADSLQCSKSTVSYHAKRFLQHGFLRLKTPDVCKIYEATPLGSKVLTRSEKVVKDVVVLEDYPFKFKIIEPEKFIVGWVKLGDPKNWIKLGVKIGGITVEKHGDKSIVIHTGRIRGFDINVLLVEAGRVISRVKSILENRFGMVLNVDGVPLHKPVARFYTEEAGELNKCGTVFVDGVGGLDHSPPEGIPHLEYQGLDNIKDYLLMPNRVAKIEKKVNSVDQKMNGLDNNLEQFVSSLTKLIEIRVSQAVITKQADQEKVNTYLL